MHQRPRAYSLLMVLMLIGLLGVAVGGIFAIVVRGAQTSGAMIERRRTFYACDGMGRQLAALGQAFLSRNTLEDVPEDVMEAELRAFLPRITPPGFQMAPTDLAIPKRPLLDPQPVEMITTGPFSGLEVKLQTIDMRFQARRTVSGAVCRAEQTLSLGRIALFQFFAFADVPLIELNPPSNDIVFMRGRIHSNGRICMGGAPIAVSPIVTGQHAVRLDARVTAVERVLHGFDQRCGFGGGEVGIVGFRAPGPQEVGAPDRLFEERLLEPLRLLGQSGCGDGVFCPGGWRSFALQKYLGRVQDTDHEVQELTLPVDPPVRFTQVGWAANGGRVLQQMSASTTRPNTRFLVEPVLTTRDPPSFSRNKMAAKAQLRIIDGVWYVKDPGEDNAPDEIEDDGPWPGIPIWSDHPGEFTANLTNFTREGVEGSTPIEVGQSDIRAFLEETTDTRLEKAQWSKRKAIGASPTPRRFSFYGFVDRDQADTFTNLDPQGPGLQYGRVVRASSSLDVDPPAVISYGAIAPVPIAGQTYWLPGLRVTDRRLPKRRTLPLDPDQVGFCGGRTDGAVSIDPVADNFLVPAIPPPMQRVIVSNGESSSVAFFAAEFPAPESPLPSDGRGLAFASGDSGWPNAAICSNDRNSESAFRRRMRLALLESTRTGFRDTNAHGDTVFPNDPAPQPDMLPINVNLHALQEALADKTPGELGSYFCRGCLWEKFEGTIYITNTWSGSMLSRPFPDGASHPPPSPVINDASVLARDEAQPRAPREDHSTMGPLPYPLCASRSDESARAHAQVVGHRFVEADEVNATDGAPDASGYRVPFAANSASSLANTFRRPMRSPGRPDLLTPPEDTPTRLRLPTDLTGGAMRGSFNIPSCRLYSAIDGPFAAARPTVVRLINGRTLNFNRALCGPRANAPCQPTLSATESGAAVSAVGRIGTGLNIVSNVPVYVVGDMNMTSEIVNVQTGQKATDWIPFMIAGDTMTTLSNSWSDQGSRWAVATANGDLEPDVRGLRRAATTQYNMLLLTGVAGSGVHTSPAVVAPVGVSGGGLPGSMRLMEDWGDAEHRFRGSIVLGWMPVYTQWRVAGIGNRSSFPPMLRDWQFDRHLNATSNQPPDSPVFDVTALRSWRRE